MPSMETFSSNVKRLLAQRNIRIKDLASRIGLSESYLSLVLNGTKRNLGDEFKDRIASVLNVSVSLLYSDNITIRDRDEHAVAFQDPTRESLRDVIDSFIAKTHLQHRRAAFYIALGTSTDQDVYALRHYFTEVLREFGREDGSLSDGQFLDLPEDEASLLALYSIAGQDAKLEWVKAISGVSEHDFGLLTDNLKKRGFLSLAEDGSTFRVRLNSEFSPVSSIFGQAKLREVHLNLARAMQVYQDDRPDFLHRLAGILVKALLDREAVECFEKAASGFEQRGMLNEAVASWHEAAIVHGLLDSPGDKGRCLCEAARCAGAVGAIQAAEELAAYASEVLENAGLTNLHANACNLLGNVFTSQNLELAASWYKKGLKSTSEDSSLYGPLLINLATVSMQNGKTGEAENTLREIRRWAETRNSPTVDRVLSHQALLMGLIELERRNWKSAKECFTSCIEKGEDGRPEDLGSAWHNLGMIIYRTDDMVEARRHFVIAQGIHKSRDLMSSWASGSIELAKVALREGNPQEARELIDEAVSHLDDQAIHERGWMWLIEGCIHRRAQRLAEAVDAGRKAVDHFQREGAERDLACAALWLSQVFGEMGNEYEAHLTQKRAFQIYEKKHWDMRELHRECALLGPAQSNTLRGVEAE